MLNIINYWEKTNQNYNENHFTLSRMPIRQKITSIVNDTEKLKLSSIACRNVKQINYIKKSIAFYILLASTRK